LKDVYNLEGRQFMYRHINSQLPSALNKYLKILPMFIRTTLGKLKLGYLLYPKHLQTQVRKCYNALQYKSGQKFHQK